MFKTFIALLLTLNSFASELKVAYFSLPPFAYEENGVASGIAIENFKEIAKQLKWKVDFILYPFPRILHELEKNKVDAILLLGKNNQRVLTYSYPTKPSASDFPGIALSRNVNVDSIKTAADLAGIEIGVTSEGYISPFMKNEKIKLVTFNSDVNYMTSILEALAKRKDLDAFYLPTISSLKFIGVKEKLLSQLKFLRTPEEENFFYTVFRKNIDQNIMKSYNSKNIKIVKYHE